MALFDPQKYWDIFEKSGASAAITALQEDMRELENETFEGRDGYRPELWELLRQMRAFSLELWNRASETNPSGC